jgi:hypothetical protein
MAVTLSDEEFALLFDYLDREHSITWDPDFVGLTTKLGKQLWDRVRDIGTEQGLVAQHIVRFEVQPYDPGESNDWDLTER